MQAIERLKSPRAACAALCALAIVSIAEAASAQSIIKRPGAHPRYSAEVEPHLLVQWADEDPFNSAGFGLGVRATVPFLDNGPIPKINNNMGIGFGLDWAFFSEDNCGLNGRVPAPFNDTYDCSGNDIWFPVVVQWNFFLTDIISVFAEPGLAIEYETWNVETPAGVDYDDDDLDVEPVFQLGGRFLFGETVGLTLRLGFPYVSAGASFLF